MSILASPLWFFPFVGGACRPTPPPSLFTGSILSWIVPIRLFGCHFHLQTLSLQEKATPKSGMAETWTVTAPLPYIAYFPFTTSPYRRICVLMYAYVAVWPCCHIYVNTNIRLYVYTPICIYGLPCGQFFIGWPFICRPPKIRLIAPFLVPYGICPFSLKA